jgi:hypothetical protein
MEKKVNNSLTGKMKLRAIAGGTLALLGAVGVGFHGYYITAPGPLWVFPNFLGLWLASLTFVFSLQSFYIRKSEPLTRFRSRVNVYYYALLCVVSALLCIGYFVGYRPDGGAWSIALFLAALLDLLLSRRNDADATWRSSPFSTQRIGLIDYNTQAKPARHPLPRLAVAANTTLRAIALILAALLLGGCWVQAIGYRMYPPRGQFVKLNYAAGQTQAIHVYCAGERNSTLPTFWFVGGGGGHSMSDLWGLQAALVDRSRRVCQYDVPGLVGADVSDGSRHGVVRLRGAAAASSHRVTHRRDGRARAVHHGRHHGRRPRPHLQVGGGGFFISFLMEQVRARATV